MIFKFTIFFLFISCSTTIMREEMYRHSIISLPASLKNKTITVRVFHLNHWTQDVISNKTRYVISQNEILKNEVKEILAPFHDSVKINYAELEAKSFDFGVENTLKDVFLVNGRKSSNSDYYLDVYSFYEGPQYIHSYKILWGIAHIFTLGILPVTYFTELNIKADLYKKDTIEEKYGSSSIDNGARFWMWSPFQFRSDSRWGHHADFTAQLSSSTAKKAIADVFEILK